MSMPPHDPDQTARPAPSPSPTPGPTPSPRSARGERTLALLWDRVRQQGDMPGFTRAISAILGAMRGEDEQEFNMAQTVLSDPVLTQKVLRLANSGMYAAFGRSLNTVTKAVMVLGTDTIGHLALGLKMIEELSDASPDSAVAHAEMEKAVLAGMVARQIAAGAIGRHAEEAVVCSILQSLGRMLLTFYLAERWAELQRHSGAGNEAAAAPALLGLTLEEIGRAAAARWGLPAKLIDGMRQLEPPAAGDDAALAAGDWLAGLATLSSRCADALWHDDERSAGAVEALARRYAGMLGVEPPALLGAIEQAKSEAATDLSLAPLSKPAERRAEALASERLRAASQQTLLSGVIDLREMVGTARPGEIISVALETVYQGLDFSRAVAFVRNHKEGRYGARLGLGEGVADLMPRMEFGDLYEPNVFHAALRSDRVIFIDNAQDAGFAAKLPTWWKQSLRAARSFVILPLSVHGQPNGFIYGDWNERVPPIQLSKAEFTLLNELRALITTSAELRHQPELGGQQLTRANSGA